MALLGKLGNYKDFGLLVMRAGVGAMMILHGYPKLLGGPDKWESLGGSMKNIGIHFMPVFWGGMAAVAETIGGLFLILGFFFRPSALLLCFTMVIAAMSHLYRGQGINEASHAITLGFVFFGLIFLGPGKYSVDKS